MDERERLSEIMKSQGYNAKQFSEVLGVSAGSISNIMGGRNKPSNDFLKIVAATFPFISRAWLFMGEGEMYKQGYEPTTHRVDLDLFSTMETNISSVNPQPTTAAATNVVNKTSNQVANTQVMMPISTPQRAVHKIVIFYTDGTFEER